MEILSHYIIFHIFEKKVVLLLFTCFYFAIFAEPKPHKERRNYEDL